MKIFNLIHSSSPFPILSLINCFFILKNKKLQETEEKE